MRHPLISFAKAHRFHWFLLTTLGCGMVAVAIARVPLPQTTSGLAEYTHAVGFFLAPLLSVPAVSMSLPGIQPYERQAARSLVGFRLPLATAESVWVLLTLLPSAFTQPTPNAVQVLVENTTAILGLTLLLGCWLRPRWVWAPVFALTMIGVNGPDYGWLSKVAYVDRTASLADLVTGVVLLATGIVVYAMKGAAHR